MNLRDWKAGAENRAELIAKAKGREKSLEAAVKSTKAAAYARLRDEGKSQGDAAEMARLDETYQTTVDQYANAVTEHAALSLKHQIEMAALDAWRSMEATKRSEMKL